MNKLFGDNYFKVSEKTKISQFQTMVAYLGGSAFQTVVDNPITAYRQLVQQYAKVIQQTIFHPYELHTSYMTYSNTK